MYQVFLKLSNYFIVVEILISSMKLSSFSIDDNGMLLLSPQNREMTITLKGEIVKGSNSIKDIELVEFEKAFLVNISKKNSFRYQEWALFDVQVLEVKLNGNEIEMQIKYSDKVKLL